MSTKTKRVLSARLKEQPFARCFESVGRVRGISAHVETGDVELLDPDKVGFTLTAKSSAAAMFAAPCVRLTDKQGEIQRLNHLQWLTAAVARIARAIANAKGS